MIRWKPSLVKDSCHGCQAQAHECLPGERQRWLVPGHTHLFVHVQLPEDLGRVQEMGVVEDPGAQVSKDKNANRHQPRHSLDCSTYLWMFHPKSGTFSAKGIQ